VVTPGVTLIKPIVSVVAPTSIQAGDEITITGTDLDLVTEVKISGKACTIATQTETEITATTPMDASIAGEDVEVAVILANGVSVTATIDVTFPAFCFVLEFPAPDVEIKAGELLKVTVENSDKLTGVQVNGNNVQYILQGKTLYIAIPNNASGTTELKLISSNGEATYNIQVIGMGVIETVIFQGPVDITWNDRAVIPATAFDGVSVGTIMKIYFTQKDAWGQAQINNGKWAVIPFAELGNDGYLKTDIYNDKSISEQELVLTREILNNIATNQAPDGDFAGAGIIIQGQDWIITKITLVTSGGGSSGGVDPVWNADYVFFDFNDGTKNSWWGQVNVNTVVGNLWQGVENDPSQSLDGTPYARVNNGGGMFFRNGADNMKLDDVTLNGWVVKFDTKVISGSGNIRLELKSSTDNTQYMAVVAVADQGGWFTITVPFSEFKDNWGSGTNSLPDLNIDEFGATDGGEGNTMELLIDNVRFEPINP
jgi:hypothetical protein